MSPTSSRRTPDLQEFFGRIPSAFHSLAAPEIQSLLHELPPSFTALGVSREGTPIGLAVVERQKRAGMSHLLALTIADAERGRGYGHLLLSALETSLRQKGTHTLGVEYVSGTNLPSVEAGFLTACGFATPRPGIFIWGGPLQVIHDLPWVERMRLPEAFTCDFFTTLTAEERSFVKNGLGVWYPPILSPFADEDSIDCERSLVLRYLGVVVGWLILERFDARTVLYKTMFVHRRHQRMGRGVALVAEASRRLVSDPEFQDWVFFVEAENEGMVRFMNDHISRPVAQKEVLWRTVKKL
ncbi:GNAT family N-acetyltransferase [Tumebacillus sp. ITR2]|uniref:GNAT family N-acetyltransferase n=1 Tax=Tumebacillus amylolyticus TaxID=2801339 RepID=A0ABS1JGT2_9BACL|nr:GNAT family N-acetyltransferase [Tumebacillus amylolyticus]MBL0389499.1 GNAT family N-acetyltransferase [Tumebacillus amylolyticus]